MKYSKENLDAIEKRIAEYVNVAESGETVRFHEMARCQICKTVMDDCSRCAISNPLTTTTCHGCMTPLRILLPTWNRVTPCEARERANELIESVEKNLNE